MAVHDRHAVGLGADGDVRREQPPVAHSPQQLGWFVLQLFRLPRRCRGTTLSWMSSDDTPGQPAPEMACIVVRMTASTPNASWKIFSGRMALVVEQLGLATMKPGQPFSARCAGMSAVVGVNLRDKQGTVGSMRRQRCW